MNTKERRSRLYEILQQADKPLRGSELAAELSVSRQIIVGDISILRAGGAEVYATPQGYLIPHAKTGGRLVATLACRHANEADVEAELHTMVDNGAKVLDVIVEHPLYGEIRADLMIASRRDVAEFISRLRKYGAAQLSLLTGGLHLHTLEVENEAALASIKAELAQLGILCEE